MDNGNNPFEGSNIIFAYTRAMAIADGVLHDVSETAKECGFSIPVAVTDTIWRRWVEVDHRQELLEVGQSTDARLRDLLMVLHMTIRKLPKDANTDRLTFVVRFLMAPEDETVEEAVLTSPRICITSCLRLPCRKRKTRPPPGADRWKTESTRKGILPGKIPT